jgi:hypothetical protein
MSTMPALGIATSEALAAAAECIAATAGNAVRIGAAARSERI